MHARYYSPTLGRFLSVDSYLDVDRAMRRPQGWNRYSYVENNPIGSSDPTGLATAEAIYSSNAFDETWTSFTDYAWGVASAFGTDLIAGVGRPEPTSDAMKVGQTVGDAAASWGGAAEAKLGAGTALGGLGLMAGTSGGSTIVSVPAVVLGTLAAVHGTIVTVTADLRLIQAAQMSGAGDRSGGGRTAGKVGKDARTGGRQRVDQLRQELKQLQSNPNKTPADKAEIGKKQRELNRAVDQLRKSEEHARTKQHS